MGSSQYRAASPPSIWGGNPQTPHGIASLAVRQYALFTLPSAFSFSPTWLVGNSPLRSRMVLSVIKWCGKPVASPDPPSKKPLPNS
jgi:hypothetical protein